MNRNSDQNNSLPDDNLSGLLGEAVRQVCDHEPPHESVAASLQRAEEIDIEMKSVLAANKVRSNRRSLLALAASLTLMCSAAWWILQPRIGLAEVANAMQQQVWIHVVSEDGEGVKREAWLSPKRDIAARKDKDQIRYDDFADGVYFLYDTDERVLYRTPHVGHRRMGFHEQMFDAMRLLFSTDRAVDDPLGRLKFISEEQRSQMNLLSQKRRKVTEGDREWLEYSMRIRHAQSTSPVEVTFRANSDTKLLYSVEFKGEIAGKAVRNYARFDYPSEGPSDVYAIGVPEDAKYVDRVPSKELQKIIDGIAAARVGFDDYRAIVVEHSDRESIMWWHERPKVFYRKGDKFRSDYGLRQNAEASKTPTKKPDDDEDLAAWWKERIKQLVYYTPCISHGSTTYRFDRIPGEHESIKAKMKFAGQYETTTSFQDGDVYPAYYGSTPDFSARGPLGIRRPDAETKLDENPSEGPAGTVLVEVKEVMPLDPLRRGSNVVEQPSLRRFWIDPHRGYLVMRSVEGYGDDGNDLRREVIVEEVAQSPNGNWYPTLIRRRDLQRDQPDRLVKLYVDFDYDLKDELFDIDLITK